MARFDVRRERGTDALLLDCQADLLSYLTTRFVIPLEPEGDATPVTKGLNPIFELQGKRMVMATQLAAAVPTSALGETVGSFAEHDFVITDAIDFLLSGI